MVGAEAGKGGSFGFRSVNVASGRQVLCVGQERLCGPMQAVSQMKTRTDINKSYA